MAFVSTYSRRALGAIAISLLTTGTIPVPALTPAKPACALGMGWRAGF